MHDMTLNNDVRDGICALSLKRNLNFEAEINFATMHYVSRSTARKCHEMILQSRLASFRQC